MVYDIFLSVTQMEAFGWMTIHGFSSFAIKTIFSMKGAKKIIQNVL